MRQPFPGSLIVTRNDNHDKVMAYGLAFLHTPRCKQAILNGMAENLPPSDVLTPDELTQCIAELTGMNREHFERWGLGHLLTD